MGHLSAGIAHDFNNMLTGILSAAKILEMKHAVSEDHSVFLEIIRQSGERASKLVAQILDFSRKTLNRPEYLFLDMVLLEQVPFWERTIGENIRLCVKVEPNYDYSIYFDPGQLSQIVLNLIVNARDAMPNGGRIDVDINRVNITDHTILCELCGFPLSGEYITLKIRDKGEGIPAEYRNKIFEPYSSTKKPGKGTGLGLSQVFGIVTQHAGHLTLWSEINVGTEFTLYFRCHNMNSSNSSEDKPEVALIKGEGRTVLIIEDESMVLDIHNRFLKNLGFKTYSARTAQEAFELYQRKSKTIDVVLSDIVLPDKNGAWIYNELIKIEPKLKFIVVSGYPLDGELFIQNTQNE